MQKDYFISEKLKKEIYKGYSYVRAGINNYGLGIHLKEWDSGQKMFFHNGWRHGSRASCVTIKKEGVTLMALTNANTRKVYCTSRLSSLFGNYSFALEEEAEESDSIYIPFVMVDDTFSVATLKSKSGTNEKQ